MIRERDMKRCGNSGLLSVAILVVGSPIVFLQPSAQQSAAPASVSMFAFRGVTVVDVTDGSLHSAQTVVVVGARVQAIGPTHAVRIPHGARIIDARGKYLIPGLWDMHTHLWNYPDIVYPLLIANGVTGIRDVGTGVPLDTLHRWHQEILAGTRVGPPRQFFAGPMLDEVAAEADCRLMCFEGRQPYFPVPTPARARVVVDSLQAAGADFIKVHAITSPEIYYAIVAEAKRVSIPFAGHVPDFGHRITALEASDSGQRTEEHLYDGVCVGDTASIEKCRPFAQHLARNHTWSVLGPVWRSSRVTERMRLTRLRYWPDSVTHDFLIPAEVQLDSVTRRTGMHLEVAEQAGLPLLMGTDLGPPAPYGVIGFALHDDLAFYVNEGLTPLAALRAVTLNPADAMGLLDSLGGIAPGKLADLVLLDANPLADIYNTTTIRAVVANGRYFDRTALDALLAKLERGGSRRWVEYTRRSAP